MCTQRFALTIWSFQLAYFPRASTYITCKLRHGRRDDERGNGALSIGQRIFDNLNQGF